MQLFSAIAIGFLFSFFLPQYSFLKIPSYDTVLYTLLAIGLYGAVYGITAIILALIISQWVNQTISIICFAVITINILYYLTNYLLERKLTLDSNS